MVKMGDAQNNLDFSKRVGENMAFVIPAGKWHNLINIGNEPIKLFSITFIFQAIQLRTPPLMAISLEFIGKMAQALREERLCQMQNPMMFQK